MTKKYFFIVGIILCSLLFSSIVYADFSVFTNSSEKTVCIGSTAVIVDTVRGSPGQYSIETAGTATSFTTTVPSEFSLKESQNIYSYITINSKVKPGVYDLIIKVKFENITKEQVHKIIAKDCHGTSLIIDGDKKACPCEKVKYKLTLENLGEFKEKFNIKVEGTAKDWINLSKSSIELKPGESEDFYAYVQPPCNIHGEYSLTFKAIAENSLAGATIKAKLEILPCYEYSLELNKSYSICENEKLDIPLKISNKGTADNKFALILEGPQWAVLESNSVEINAGSEKIVDINLQPPLKTKGNFTLKIETMTSSGSIKKNVETIVYVRKCYGLDIKLESKEEKLCRKEKEYNIILKNLGEFKTKYNLKIDGPKWVELEDDTLTIDAKDNKTIKLSINPKDAEFKKYEITITATDYVSNESDSEKLILEISKPDECYKTELSSKEDKISVEIEKSKTIFLLLKNNGLDEARYKIELEGNGAKFAMINPEEIKLKPNESETLYLYISPPLFIELKEYNISVIAEEANSKIKTEKKIIVNILKEGEKQETEESIAIEKTEKKESLFAKIINTIKDFFKKLFVVQQPISSETKINVSEIIKKNISVSEEINNSNEEEIIENETIEAIENETVMIDKTKERNENKTIEENLIEEEVNKEAEIDKEVEINKIENIESFNENIKDLLTKYKNYIIGAVVILLVIIIITSGIGKSIIEFFEEEEQPVNNKKK